MKCNSAVSGACVILLGFFSGCLDTVIAREWVRGSGSISKESHRFTGLTGVELATMGELENPLRRHGSAAGVGRRQSARVPRHHDGREHA